MKPVLVTGFEPFGGDERNPSTEIAAALDGRKVRAHPVVGAELPCVFGAARTRLCSLLRRHQPVLVIGLGLARNRTDITPERVAINVEDARIPDNAGAQPVDRPVVARGPVAYWSTLPVKAIVTQLRRDGLPASVSQTAGTFVCNHAFYALMHELRRRRGVRGGFLHVPWPADWAQGTGNGPTFAQLVRAVERAIAVSLRERD